MNKDIEEYYSEVLKTFAEIGYPQDFIGQWTLPQRDSETIIKLIQETRPANILEVGTFVGVTTLLMALASSPETHIHTIDPNFPLRVEMESMKSRLFATDTTVRAQELALQAAERLGVERKITFHAGGFSTHNTFASYNTSPSSRIDVIGPDVCKLYGPFDFIFVDGLHYEEDVFQDLRLAAENLLPHGSIVIHDVLGRWGSNVRRGVFRFLEHRDDFHFSHSKYSKLYNSIGLLKHEPDSREGDAYKTEGYDFENEGIIQERLYANLGVLLINKFSFASVLQIGGDIKLLETLAELGINECDYCGFPSIESQHDSISIKQIDLNKKIHFEKKYDLCLCFEIMDTLPADSADNVVEACVEASDTVIFASTPPGELGTYYRNNKPLIYWVSKFFEKGYLFSDEIRPLLEPHLDILYAEFNHNSSHLMNIYLVKKDKILSSSKMPKTFCEDHIFDKERRIEDLQLQNLYLKCLIQEEIINYRKIVHEEYPKLVTEMSKINIMNERVLRNTYARIKEIFFNIVGQNKERF